jgi:hypothetical protein
VTELLAAGSRQSVQDRLKAGTLLGILDHGKWRFPFWPFDADGPNGVIDGLVHLLQALPLTSVAAGPIWALPPGPSLAVRGSASAMTLDACVAAPLPIPDPGGHGR